MPCILTHAVQRQDLGATDVCLGSGQYHSSFTGRDILHDAKAKATEIPESAGLASVILRFDGVGAVLDHFRAVAVANGQDFGHDAGPACEVYRKDGGRARRYAIFDAPGSMFSV